MKFSKLFEDKYYWTPKQNHFKNMHDFVNGLCVCILTETDWLQVYVYLLYRLSAGNFKQNVH